MIVLAWKGAQEKPVFYFTGDSRSWTEDLHTARKFVNVQEMLAFFLAEKEPRGWLVGPGTFAIWAVKQLEPQWELQMELA